MKFLFDPNRDRFGVKVIVHALMGVMISFLGSKAAFLSVEFFYDITGLDAPALPHNGDA